MKPTLVQLILNATAAGKAMLTAADAAAQRVLLSLQNVDNTSDADKPVSTAQAAADALRVPYSGANASLNLGSQSLSCGDADFRNGAITVRQNGANYTTITRASGLGMDLTGSASVLFRLGATTIEEYGTFDIYGSTRFFLPTRPAVYTVATLPSASANSGFVAQVTDSSVTTFRGTVAGGGANRVMVFSNGTNWLVI